MGLNGVKMELCAAEFYGISGMFFDKITLYQILTFIYNLRATTFFVFFSENEVFAPLSHKFLPKLDLFLQKTVLKFTISDLVRIISDLVLIT